MKYLRKLWLRVLISFLLGGLCSELLRMKYEVPNQLVLFFAAILFILFTIIVVFSRLTNYFFGTKNKEEGREDILDD